MKKVLSVLTIALSLGQLVELKAGNDLPDGAVRAEATEQTRALATYLGIAEYDYLQVKKLHEARLLEIKAAAAEYEDTAILALHLKDIDAKYEKAILFMLDDRQKQAFHQLKKSRANIFMAAK